MTVQFTFDKSAVERQGCSLEDVRRTIKTLFAVHDLPCIDDSDSLTFQDKGHGDDFAVMWDIIMSLLRADWFVDCAASCVWKDEDGEEDVLAQTGKVCGAKNSGPKNSRSDEAEGRVLCIDTLPCPMPGKQAECYQEGCLC